MEFSVKIEGIDRLARSTDQIKARAKSEIEKALFASGKQVEKEAKLSITNGQKSGRLYKRGKAIFHRASAPGEAPASDTGRLVNSINTTISGLEALVVAGRGAVKYARMLEFGTSKIAPRPFMFPALEKSKAWITNRLNQAMQRALK